MADEKLALVIELGALKDDFVAFREKAAADREAIEAEFYSRGDTLFNYGYGCCDFTYNICGRKPQIPDGMPNPSVLLTADVTPHSLGSVDNPSTRGILVNVG